MYILAQQEICNTDIVLVFKSDLAPPNQIVTSNLPDSLTNVLKAWEQVTQNATEGKTSDTSKTSDTTEKEKV